MGYLTGPKIANPWCFDIDRMVAHQPCLHRWLDAVPPRHEDKPPPGKNEMTLWTPPGDWCIVVLRMQRLSVRVWYYSDYGKAAVLSWRASSWEVNLVPTEDLKLPKKSDTAPPVLEPSWFERQ